MEDAQDGGCRKFMKMNYIATEHSMIYIIKERPVSATSISQKQMQNKISKKMLKFMKLTLLKTLEISKR